jgi:hypothetical protein
MLKVLDPLTRLRSSFGRADSVVPPALVPAAQSFYKALKVYPNPPDLLDIYKKTISAVVPDP